jgi:hypothetical protein
VPVWIVSISDNLDDLNREAPGSWRARMLAHFLIYALIASGF